MTSLSPENDIVDQAGLFVNNQFWVQHVWKTVQSPIGHSFYLSNGIGPAKLTSLAASPKGRVRFKPRSPQTQKENWRWGKPWGLKSPPPLPQYLPNGGGQSHHLSRKRSSKFSKRNERDVTGQVKKAQGQRNKPRFVTQMQGELRHLLNTFLQLPKACSL